MKHSQLLLIILFIFSFGQVLNAQNSMFIEFNTSRTELLDYLEKKGNVEYQHKSNDVVIANEGANELEYKFNEQGNLYRTVLQRDFKTRQQAISFYSKLSEFHTRINGNMTNEVMMQDQIKKVVRRGSMINELHLVKSVDKKYTIKIIKKDKDFEPNGSKNKNTETKSFS